VSRAAPKPTTRVSRSTFQGRKRHTDRQSAKAHNHQNGVGFPSCPDPDAATPDAALTAYVQAMFSRSQAAAADAHETWSSTTSSIP
jgi:hypothetical protein